MTKHVFSLLPVRRIWLAILAVALMVAPSMVFAASERCTGGGFSVWCHKFWFGYTKCNLYDEDSDMVSEFVDPDTACQSIQ